MDNVELMKEGYANFAKGDIEAVLAIWDPEIEWKECKGMPIVTGDGKFVGGQSVVANVFAKIPEQIDGFQVEIHEVFGTGDRVVMIGEYVGTYKPTGKPFRSAVAHVWTFKDGKATKFLQFADTAEIIHPKD